MCSEPYLYGARDRLDRTSDGAPASLVEREQQRRAPFYEEMSGGDAAIVVHGGNGAVFSLTLRFVSPTQDCLRGRSYLVLPSTAETRSLLLNRVRSSSQI